MRTHLLRTVYPAIAATEPDTGSAANDACYADHEADATRTKLSLIVPLPTRDEHDDYVLGGYAGI